MKPHGLSPNSHHAVYVKCDEVDGHHVEHGFGAQIPRALNLHESPYADQLRGQAHDQKLA